MLEPPIAHFSETVYDLNSDNWFSTSFEAYFTIKHYYHYLTLKISISEYVRQPTMCSLFKRFTSVRLFILQDINDPE